MFKIILAYFLFFLFSTSLFCESGNQISSVPVSSPTKFIQQDFDVLHYDADIDFTKAPAKDMSGVCRITFRWLGNPDTSRFYFHLRSLVVDSVFYNGTKTSVSEKETPDSPTYHYSLAQSKGKAGDTVLLTIYYHGKMTAESETQTFGGVSTMNGCLFSVGVGFHNNYVSATQHWLACYDHPSDKATFNFNFLTKTGFSVESNGECKVEELQDGRTIYHWYSKIPTATYMFTFAVDSLATINFQKKTYPIVVSCKPEDSTATKYAFSLLPQMVDVLESCFGPYPFEKVGYVVTPLTTGAMEHQTMVTFPRDVVLDQYFSKDSNNTMALHELAHQWFGDAVSVQDFRDAWMSESFATFCEALWTEKFKNYRAYLDEIYINIYRYINNFAPQEGIFPIYDYPRNSPSSNYPYTIYKKGAVVVAMLRHELGDRFFEILKDYIEQYKYSNISTDDFRKFLEAKSGKKLDWFFNQWIYGKGWPQLSIYINMMPYPDNLYARVSISLAQEQPEEFGTYTNLPIELTFKKKDKSHFGRIISMKSKNETIVLDSIPYFIDVIVNQGDSLRTLMVVNSLISKVDENTQTLHDDKISIIPNPAEDNISVKFNAIFGQAEIETYDLQGRMLYSCVHQATEGENQINLDVDDYPSGLYFIRIQQGNSKFESVFQVRK